MTNPHHDSEKIVERLLILLAVAVSVCIVVVAFWLLGPPIDVSRLLLSNVLASLLTVLMIYVLRKVLFQSTDKFLSQNEVRILAEQIAKELQKKPEQARNIIVYERWYDIPWQEVLANVNKVEFYASYMDTWLIQTAHLLPHVFERGGTVRAFLPKPGSDAAKRIVERIPEHTIADIAKKIEDTAKELEETLRKEKLKVTLTSNHINKKGQLEVFWTTVFCMYCAVRIDDRYLILAPFEHFRKGRIGNPAFFIDLKAHPRIAEWIANEFLGFENASEHSVFSM